MRMPHGIQWKITFPFIAVIAVCIGVMGIYLANFVHVNQTDNLRIYLTNEAKITAVTSQPFFPSSTNELDALAKQLGTDINARVTIIAADGTVLGDSEQNPATIENHSTRPEVMAALSTGYGESVRYSTTLNERMMYVAVSCPPEGCVMPRRSENLSACLASSGKDSLSCMPVTLVGMARRRGPQ